MNTQKRSGYNQQGKKIAYRRKTSRSKSVLSTLIASVSVNADVFMLLAQAKRQLNQPEGVEQALLDALSVDPKHAEAKHQIIANHFLLSGKPQDRRYRQSSEC